MNEGGIITKEESASFRKGRVIWIAAFGGAVLGMAIKAGWLFGVGGLIFLVTTPALMLWRCPRCNKPYCVTFDRSFPTWPFSGSCVHCGSELEKG
jgi:hypothetical protein